jgi:single-stranded-DNA-specific exonuclease
MIFSSVTGKNWLSKNFDSTDLTKYVENYSLTEITAKLLSIRKRNISDIQNFLEPKIKNLLPNPLKLKDMDKAIKRTYECIINDEVIGIFGDYDVDGASSTALLARYFTSLNKKILTYIPDRQKEGYGPSEKGFNNLIAKGAKLIFTVDCGTLAFKPIDVAQKINTDIIVLDHHQSDTKLPNACALVNPNRYDDQSGLNYLCAAGVCFVFLVAMNKLLRDKNWFKINKIEEPNILNYLDLVSLGTVCDVVPLVDLNRAIVKQGLKIIKSRKNLGLKTLYDICKIQSQPTTYDLGFKIGPRINAGGRLGKASHGAELLISEEPQKAYQIAIDLEKSNLERQSIQAMLSDQVDEDIKKYHNHPVLVLSGSNWHEGVIGIVASRIKDKFNKPTILISLKNNIGKGSARSVVGFDIGSQIIQSVQSNILEFGGGHKMAGGFTIKEHNIPKFRDLLIKNYEKNSSKIKNNMDLYFDTIISPSALNEDFMNQINLLSPFGPGNSEPRFIIENIQVLSSKVIANNHIRSILLGKDGTRFTGFTWNSINTLLESYLMNISKKKINIAGKIKLNEWKGEKKVEFIIEDISLFS